MKKLALIIGVLLSLNSIAQWNWFKVEGNGVYKKETREVGSFSGIATSGSWAVMLAYGNSNSIEIEGDENLLEYIETKVENGKLHIRAKKNGNIRSKNKIVVYVSISQIKGLYVSGSGDIIGKGKFSNAGTTNIGVSGSGNIKLDFDRFDGIDASVSGSGGIILKGTSNAIYARISGSGNINCKEVVSDDVTASISGSGNIRVQANTSIDARIAGSGSVFYTGGAKNVRTHKAGSGRIVKG
ncbi:MAG: head GIN domain-containing protein [Bacteroidota bacterium]